MPNFLNRGMLDEVHQGPERRASLNRRSPRHEDQSIPAQAVDDASDPRITIPALHISDALLTGKIGREDIYGDDR